MRKINLEKSISNSSKEKLWTYVIGVEKYPEYIPYVRKVIIEEELSQGSTWYDTTSILWVPMKFRHTTISLTPYKEMSFQVHIPFKGHMIQQYILSEENGQLMVKANAEFHLGNKLIDKLVGSLLKKRLQKMMVGSLANLSLN